MNRRFGGPFFDHIFTVAQCPPCGPVQKSPATVDRHAFPLLRRPKSARVRIVLLYDNPFSGNCYKVRLLFAHLGLAYERQTLDVADRSNRPDLLGGLNPSLRVPTLVLDDGRSLGESGAILWYFGEGTDLIPTDPYERAQVLQWMFFEQYDHEPAIAVVRFWLLYSGRPEAFADRIEERSAAGHRALAAMERHLEGRDFLVGVAPTLADIALFAYTHVAEEGGFSLAGYPAIRAWLARVQAMPGHVPIDA
jgi:glutathione S-transferase